MITATAARLTPDRYPEYERLSQQVRYGVNLHPLWLATYVDVFAFGDKVVMLEARDEHAALQGLLPLVRKDSEESRFVTFRRLVAAGYGPTDFFAIPAAAGRETEVAEAAAQWLARHTRAWDQLMINLVPADGGAAAAFADAMAGAGFTVTVKSDRNYLRLDTRGSFDDYVARLGTPKAKELRYYRNRLLKRGTALTVEHLTEGLATHFEEFVALYTGRREAKTQSDPYTRVKALYDFVKAIVPAYEARGWMTLSLLRLDGQIIAYCYCLVYGGVLFYYMPTFREEYKDCAPGKLLLHELIRRAFETPSLVEFNFMRSEYAYKHWFEPQTEPYYTITVDNHASVRARALRMIERVRRLHAAPAEAQ